MANTCAAMGFATKMLVEPDASPHTFNASSERYAIKGENLKAIKRLQGRTKIIGTRSQMGAYLRRSTYLVQGSIVMEPGPAELSNWLPRFMGAAPSGNSYTLGNTLPSFGILFDKENGIIQVKDAKVNAVVFRSRSREGADGGQEEFVEMILNIIGIAETQDDVDWPSPEPAIAFTAAYIPYQHWEGTLAMGSIADVPYRNFALTINNMLRPLYYNKITPNCLRSQGRSITLATENPFIEDTFGLSLDAYEAGVAGTLTFVNGNMSTVFTMPALRNNYETPSIQGKGEIPLALELEATATNGENELSITHDATP